MSKSAALMLTLSLLLTGCVTTGDTGRKVDPEQARDAYIQLGLGYLQKGETERAKKPLSEALALDPKSAAANTALALVFQYEGEYETAEKHFLAALAGDPQNARILNNYGAFLLDRERYPEALGYFQKASEDTLYAERSRVFENLGLTYQRMGAPAEARESFERSLRLNSRQPRALLELAQLEFQAQDYVPAWQHYRAFAEMSGQNAASLGLGIQLAKRFEDHSRAASYALQLKRLYPASPEAKALMESE
ncbi:type IV pilus biogenesis/stability protein PilW [Halopseudomonas sp.]|uniref:type IV pilus biogenesis/stability protein PilW n=1 Tax=Halopseudomonas sp. TaxID=2901191 RepID=UPI003002F63A